MILLRAQRVLFRRRRSSRHIGERGEKSLLKQKRQAAGPIQRLLRVLQEGWDLFRGDQMCR